MYSIIRQEIYNEAILRKNFIPDVIIETNNGNIKINEYIDPVLLNLCFTQLYI